MIKNIVGILIIGPTPPPYHGVAQATQMLLGSKLKERFKIFHLDLADRRGIEFVDKPDFHDVVLFLKQWFWFIRIVLKERPQVIYLPISQSAIGFFRDSFFIWPAFFLGKRIILHLHGGNFKVWYERRGWMMKTYVRWTLKPTSNIIVLGESLRNLFREFVSPEKIVVVSNGIPWPSHGYLPDKKTSGKPRQYRVLYLGTLNRLKGVLVLISAVSFVVKVREDIEFLFAGTWSHGEDQTEAQKIISNHGLEKFIRFVGQVEGNAKRLIYESSDLFVFPGIQQEGQPLVVIEAMAAGLPILFTNRGCLKETVQEGENGLEILPDNPHDLAEKMLWMLSQPLEMKRMGEQSRLRYEKYYTSDQFAENMIHLFENTAKDNL